MPTTRAKNILYRLLLPVSAPGCGRNPLTAVSGHPLQTERSFIRLIQKNHILGSATLLYCNGQESVLYTSSETPCHRAKEDSFFRVASITKTATALLVMKLVGQGILELDESVNTWLSAFSGSLLPDEITLRHLLSHTSGLTDPPELETFLENGVPYSDFIGRCCKHPPGTAFVYSNLGYGLIGCILEAAMELPLGTIFRNILFHPLHMNATIEGCLLPPDSIMPVVRVMPYHKDRELILTKLGSMPLDEPDPSRHYGHTAGSMYTDIHSLKTLLMTLMDGNGTFLSGKLLQEMKKEQASYGKISPSLSYGLGLLRINDPFLSDGTVYGHQGFAYGCVDGAFWEEKTGNIMITLNGGCSEARSGRLGISNRDFIRWAFRKELPLW